MKLNSNKRLNYALRISEHMQLASRKPHLHGKISVVSLQLTDINLAAMNTSLLLVFMIAADAVQLQTINISVSMRFQYLQQNIIVFLTFQYTCKYSLVRYIVGNALSVALLLYYL